MMIIIIFCKASSLFLEILAASRASSVIIGIYLVCVWASGDAGAGPNRLQDLPAGSPAVAPGGHRVLRLANAGLTVSGIASP
jgi:hypothetical protein